MSKIWLPVNILVDGSKAVNFVAEDVRHCVICNEVHKHFHADSGSNLHYVAADSVIPILTLLFAQFPTFTP